MMKAEDYLNELDKVESATAELTRICHGLARSAGWWTNVKTGEEAERNVGELIALCHSELSEALEGARKGIKDDHLPHRDMLEVELADAVIRILDMAGGLNLDVAGAMAEKLAYNHIREDHKQVLRQAAGGKQY